MHFSIRLLLAVLLLLSSYTISAQQKIKGKVVDQVTKEPVAGAVIKCSDAGCNCGCLTNENGEFNMNCSDCNKLTASSVGYRFTSFNLSDQSGAIEMTRETSLMQEVVVSASRGEQVKRSEAPVAISLLSNRVIQDAKPTSVDQVLNKVSGVNMVNLGNEQHQMSIRQPISTRSLYLYMEDGIPVRTTGLFNHNALLEMNMAAVKNIEVIRGPSSSLYGSEAIGGAINFIMQAPTIDPMAKISLQGNDIGYKRVDLQSGFTKRKLGVAVGGYFAERKNGFMDYNDFRKGTFTARADYKFSSSTTLVNSLTWVNYYSDMSGTIDSAMFASGSFRNMQTFTYRAVNALRYRSTLDHVWQDGSRSSISLIYRDNSISQNPAYRIKDDYRKVGNVYRGDKTLAHGEINESAFSSYAVIMQHRKNFKWKRAVLIAGASADLSPSSYSAQYIRIKKDTLAAKYTSYQTSDSVLTDYSTRLNNYAGFISMEFSPLEKLRVTASLRYDLFHYGFDNHLKPSAFSGSADTVNQFRKLSPKIGLTYNFTKRVGIYANYSQGFVPPQVTEMYTGVKVPNLDASVFYNLEAGGWAEIWPGKFSADFSIYNLKGTNEIISVKNDDGSFSNQNAGTTSHRGIEFGANAYPVKGVSVRLSGAYSKHKFVDYVEKGLNYNGNEMSGAPNWVYNAEAWYKPAFAKGFRIGVEWQHVGSYWTDPKNSARYEGYDLINCRVGYKYRGFEWWLNVINATDRYYATNVSKGSSGYSYTMAEPRNINIGFSYDLGSLLKQK